MSRARLLVLPAALLLGGCWVTETEIVAEAQSIPLCGRHFSYQMEDDERPTRFSWTTRARTYADPKGRFAARFARLRGDVYVGQLQVLRDPDTGAPAAGPKRYIVGLVTLKEGRVSVVLEPRCDAGRVDVEGVARGYGVTLQTSGYVPGLTGPRAGILGVLDAVLGSCDLDPSPHMNPVLEVDRVERGGPELAAQAGRYEGDLFAAPERQACDGGDLRACYRLGARFARGDGVTADPRRAAPLLARACDGDVAGACLDLAEVYEKGVGLARDADRARSLYEKACRLGEAFACERLKAR